MTDDAKVALMMLGDTIDFYNDGGVDILEAYNEGEGEEDIEVAYNLALHSIKKRYDVVIKLLGGR